MRVQIESNIHQVHDVNRIVFSRIEQDMSEMKGLIDEQKYLSERLSYQVQQEQQTLYPGNKKCFGGIRLMKYQETLQRLGGDSGSSG